jgi:UDP-N-acetylglucosamine 2-epimerase (non-hydrolysing)
MKTRIKRIISVVGARPNYMKVAPIHRALQAYSEQVEHMLVHTGQHYGSAMSDSFFRDLAMPAPNEFLGVGSGSHAEQTAKIMIGFEQVLLKHKPHGVIVVGDVNSTLACALTSAKLHIPVAHVEAGLRSGDKSMPEEINRLATDSIADIGYITEESALQFLRREGWSDDRLIFTGNTMIDSLHHALPTAQALNVSSSLGLKGEEYVLCTLHRPSNVDDKEQLSMILRLLAELAEHITLVLPLHPRTRKNAELFGIADLLVHPRIRIIEPLGYIDFLSLLQSACAVVTDSGGIQEETTVLGIPCFTLRPTTERPITCDCGTNVLVVPTEHNIRQAFSAIEMRSFKQGSIPPLWDGHSAERIAHHVAMQWLS